MLQGAGSPYASSARSDDEPDRGGDPGAQEAPPADRPLEEEQRAEAEAQSHHRDPRDQGVGHDDGRVREREGAGLMEDIPERRRGAEPCRGHAVERVVKDDGREADRGQPRDRQPDEQRQPDHAEAEGPEHQQEEWVLEGGVEVVGQTHDRELEHHEPRTPGQQEARQLRSGLPAAPPQEGAQPGRQHEGRRAEVRHPAGEEEQGRRGGEIGGRAGHGAAMDEVAHVIERHDDHDRAAEGVDGLDAASGTGLKRLSRHVPQLPGRPGLAQWRPAAADDRNRSELGRFVGPRAPGKPGR